MFPASPTCTPCANVVSSALMFPRLPGPWQVLNHEIPPPQLLSWNTRQPILAVGHSSSGAVLLYNCTSAAGSAGASTLRDPQHVLVHQLQQQVSSVAWRPVHSSMLAVGCAGGVALWNLGKLPLSAAAMSRGSERATSAAAAWATFLSFRPNCRWGWLGTWAGAGSIEPSMCGGSGRGNVRAAVAAQPAQNS
jgi:hypothetical protein